MPFRTRLSVMTAAVNIVQSEAAAIGVSCAISFEYNIYLPTRVKSALHVSSGNPKVNVPESKGWPS